MGWNILSKNSQRWARFDSDDLIMDVFGIRTPKTGIYRSKFDPSDKFVDEAF